MAEAEPAAPPPGTVLVVMGVSGTGKSTVARILAERLGWAMQEGDELHAPEAVARMKAGVPLTDADRRPWLSRLAAVIDGWRREGRSGVVTCSALRRAYREIVVGDRPEVRLAYLHGDRALLERRIAARRGHYMPASLLESQLDTLEPPGADERSIAVDVAPAPERIADAILGALARDR